MRVHPPATAPVSVAAAALLVLVAAVETRSGDSPGSPPDTGSIAGRVRYVGRAPEPVYVFESGAAQAVLALDRNRGLASAAVYLHASPAPPEAAGDVVITQRNWWFTPPVVAVRAGQRVTFTSEDPSNHNVRSTQGVPANRFSAYTGAGQPYAHQFRVNADYAPAVITCDIHAWMMAWVYVFDHPHFALTGAAGEFSIPHVPPGAHRVSIRHGPGGLARDVNVTVSAGRETRVEVTFDTPDLHLPVR